MISTILERNQRKRARANELIAEGMSEEEAKTKARQEQEEADEKSRTSPVNTEKFLEVLSRQGTKCAACGKEVGDTWTVHPTLVDLRDQPLDFAGAMCAGLLGMGSSGAGLYLIMVTCSCCYVMLFNITKHIEDGALKDQREG